MKQIAMYAQRRDGKDLSMNSFTIHLKDMARRAAVAFTVVLAVAFAVYEVSQAHTAVATPGAVPDEIRTPAYVKAFFEGHAVGTQAYVCLPSPAGVAWTLITPEATLFDARREQPLTTHSFSPNPAEGGAVRATWRHSRDGSAVWAVAMPPSSDPAFVAPGAIPWLLLRVVGTQDGPAGGDTLRAVRYIQRVNTSGGAAPSTGCSQTTDVGSKAFVPYTADYVFYTNR